jgi:branched-chain amino acid transport system substrate-binding protein
VTETIEMRPTSSSNKLWSRWDVIKLLGATAITGPVILRGTTANAATRKVIKIGHVSPQTGALAPFAEADSFILDQIRAVLAKGIINGGVTYEVQIISKDSQSNTNRASEVAADLILDDKVDLLVASSTAINRSTVLSARELGLAQLHSSR